MSNFTANIMAFLSSDSTIAKFAFIVLLIITFMILLRVGTSILSWLLGPDPTPHLIDGMIKSSTTKKIHVNPNIDGAKPILKSDNQENGIEFTWSVWIFVEGNAIDNDLKHIFHKGYNLSSIDDIATTTEGNITMVGPGLFLEKNPTSGGGKWTGTLKLSVVMTTYNISTGPKNEIIRISDIPSNKWVNVMIRQSGNITDVYINGTIKERKNLDAIPLQNDGEIFIGAIGQSNNNFGLISNLWYWNYALGTTAIENVAASGPNTTMVNEQLSAKPFYLAFNWFLKNK